MWWRSVLRLAETGPKIACRYLTSPLLLRGGVKFDLRFILLLSATAAGAQDDGSAGGGLAAAVYRPAYPRMAVRRFSLDPASLDDYLTHFTV
jgi:hypothetical protein